MYMSLQIKVHIKVTQRETSVSINGDSGTIWVLNLDTVCCGQETGFEVTAYR